jgi:hypothetical protein
MEEEKGAGGAGVYGLEVQDMRWHFGFRRRRGGSGFQELSIKSTGCLLFDPEVNRDKFCR